MSQIQPLQPERWKGFGLTDEDSGICAALQSTDPKRVLVLVGSPRTSGRSVRFAKQLVHALESAGHESRLWTTADHMVGGCCGCEACRKGFSCVLDDDMHAIYQALDWCDALCLVVPVYFSGVPSQFKAVLDRMQPLWERRCGPCAQRLEDEVKRPFDLFVIGEGGDPFGFGPLCTEVRSAFGAAGFFAHRVWDLVGQDIREV